MLLHCFYCFPLSVQSLGDYLCTTTNHLFDQSFELLAISSRFECSWKQLMTMPT